MRNLFVCLLLGAVAWLFGDMGRPANPLISLSLLIAVPALAARLAPIRGQFAHVGALVAGLLLGWSGLVSTSALESVQPYTNLAAVWVGLYLGASLPVSLLRDRRLLLAVFTAAACPIVLSFAGLTLLLGFPTGSALLLALMSPISAPLFVHLSQPERKQAIWLSVLLTCTGLLLWILLVRPSSLLPQEGARAAVMLPLWVLGMEALHRASGLVRSDPGHFLLNGAAAVVLSIAASRSGVPALYLGLASGLILAVRAGRAPRCVSATGSVATMLVPLVLAAFAGKLPMSVLSGPLSTYWPLLAVYGGTLAAGKLGGILLAGSMTSIPLRDWIQTLPQGLPAAVLVLAALPPHAMPPGTEPTVFAVSLLGLSGIGLSLAAWPLQVLAIRRGALRH